MYTSTLANWDGSLSGSPTEQAQPVQGSSTSNSASTVSTTTPYLSSTSSSVATLSTNFGTPSRSTNGRRQAENDDLGAITPVSTRFCLFQAPVLFRYINYINFMELTFINLVQLGRKEQFIPNPYSADPATNRLMAFQRLVSTTVRVLRHYHPMRSRG